MILFRFTKAMKVRAIAILSGTAAPLPGRREPEYQEEIDFRRRIREDFDLDTADKGKLWYTREKERKEVICDLEGFEKITDMDINLGHIGQDRLQKAFRAQFYGFTKKEASNFFPVRS